MKKLRRYLETWVDGKKVRGIATPPLDTIFELIDIYNGVQDTTINSTVVHILNKCGISTKVKGIGWVIERS